MPDILEQLRDIHVPPEVSWWPPAPGYWLIAILLCALAAVWLVRYYRARTRRRIAKELEYCVAAFEEHGDTRRLAQEISVLLRRAAITLCGRQDVAGVTGKAWIAALENLVADKNIRFSAPVVRTLTRDIYAAQEAGPAASLPAASLIEECRRWVQALPTRRSIT